MKWKRRKLSETRVTLLNVSTFNARMTTLIQSVSQSFLSFKVQYTEQQLNNSFGIHYYFFVNLLLLNGDAMF